MDDTELKIIKLTENCDMVYKNEKEVYYFIDGGENDGVGFTILDLSIEQKDDGRIKHNYTPVIISNPYNASVQSIYNEIDEVVQAKINLYLETLS